MEWCDLVAFAEEDMAIQRTYKDSEVATIGGVAVAHEVEVRADIGVLNPEPFGWESSIQTIRHLLLYEARCTPGTKDFPLKEQGEEEEEEVVSGNNREFTITPRSPGIVLEEPRS
ncbi:hypothetical protein N1851_029171 [Merluccius polli]|uniref:Uncharacterized protein n=1 Tax=Merluccius polli TaxID=89951 RepID=A0AA47M7H0_MERPO|nr:hypothetical protein N1851_029171 [Merluccius polli]